MKRSNSSKKTRKPQLPPVTKDPKVFEAAFQKRLGLHPDEYLVEKIQNGSSLSSVEYLFDIVSAEIASRNHCVCKGFAYYHAKAQERIQAMKKHIVHNKLVRDRIPEIIEASGKTCVVEVMSQDAWKSWVPWSKQEVTRGMI